MNEIEREIHTLFEDASEVGHFVNMWPCQTLSLGGDGCYLFTKPLEGCRISDKVVTGVFVQNSC
jgi:hypothetical protein